MSQSEKDIPEQGKMSPLSQESLNSTVKTRNLVTRDICHILYTEEEMKRAQKCLQKTIEWWPFGDFEFSLEGKKLIFRNEEVTPEIIAMLSETLKQEKGIELVSLEGTTIRYLVRNDDFIKQYLPFLKEKK